MAGECMIFRAGGAQYPRIMGMHAGMHKILPRRGVPDYLRECLFFLEKIECGGARFPGVQNIV